MVVNTAVIPALWTNKTTHLLRAWTRTKRGIQLQGRIETAGQTKQRRKWFHRIHYRTGETSGRNKQPISPCTPREEAISSRSLHSSEKRSQLTTAESKHLEVFCWTSCFCFLSNDHVRWLNPLPSAYDNAKRARIWWLFKLTLPVDRTELLGRKECGIIWSTKSELVFNWYQNRWTQRHGIRPLKNSSSTRLSSASKQPEAIEGAE